MKNAIPNICTTDYSIALTSTAANLIPQKSTVGEISNVKKNKTVAYIILDDEYIKKSNMRDMLVTYLKDNSQEPIHLIYLTNSQLKKFQTKKAVELFPLYHEIGHIHYEHLLKQGQKNQNDIRNSRMSAIKNNTLTIEEKQADYFATVHFNPTIAIKALTKLKEARAEYDYQRGVLGKTMSNLALKEYDIRIKAIEANFKNRPSNK